MAEKHDFNTCQFCRYRSRPIFFSPVGDYNFYVIDFDKFSKYSKPGPRYTSYPTAPEFHEGFGAKEYVEILEKQDKVSCVVILIENEKITKNA